MSVKAMIIALLMVFRTSFCATQAAKANAPAYAQNKINLQPGYYAALTVSSLSF
jgi:hypothetical protein